MRAHVSSEVSRKYPAISLDKFFDFSALVGFIARDRDNLNEQQNGESEGESVRTQFVNSGSLNVSTNASSVAKKKMSCACAVSQAESIHSRLTAGILCATAALTPSIVRYQAKERFDEPCTSESRCCNLS